jgi:hypothetical protein
VRFGGVGSAIQRSNQGGTRREPDACQQEADRRHLVVFGGESQQE